MEDISLPGRCARGLGHGKNTVHQACPNHMARVEPLGSNGKEIPVSLVYDQVKIAAKYSQHDCKLDSLLDGIEEEVCESLVTMYFPSSWIVKQLSWSTFLLRSLDPKVRIVSEYLSGKIDRGMRRN